MGFNKTKFINSLCSGPYLCSRYAEIQTYSLLGGVIDWQFGDEKNTAVFYLCVAINPV